MIDYQEIRKEVAIEHNFLIDKDDPALVGVTMSAKVFQHYVDILVAQNTELLKALEAAQQKGIADAKLTAGRVITEGGNYVSEQVNTAVTAALDEGMAQIKRELLEIMEEVIRARARAVSASALSVACAIVTSGFAIYMTVGA